MKGAHNMQYGGYGYPATKSSGFSKSIPTYSKAVSPGFYGKPYGSGFGKPFGFGKPSGFGKPFGKSFGKPFGKSFGKPFGFGGYPASKVGGYNSVVPATTVATGPSQFGGI
jgi:hypothetical protein